MRYLIPTPITDAMLVASNIPEADHPAWSASTAYAGGARVIRTSTHSIYERLSAGTTATPPESDATNWVRVAPTNRWAMLDGVVGTATASATDISVTLRPGLVRALALLDMDVDSVIVTVRAGSDVVYQRVFPAIENQEDVDNWDDYFWSAIVRRRVLVITDLPPFNECEITITASGADISIGSCVLGALHELGTLLASPRVGITDYSRKTTDDYGATTVAQRPFSKRLTAEVSLPTARLDVAAARLARIRATPVVWIGSAVYDSLIVYGFMKDWSVVIPGLTVSTCSLEIEGLV